MRYLLALWLIVSLTNVTQAQSKTQAAVDASIDAELDDLVKLYKQLHANPELSLQEVKTSAKMADELKNAGFEVTRKFGGYGVVGVLKNGTGPTVLVRADMDGLPIIEKTGLEYASQIRTRNKEGVEVGVMHACGHDIHMSCFIGTARTLAANKSTWQGTLLFIAQPAEEVVAGARAMLDDGLYSKFGKPDFALALHADPLKPVGVVSFTDGLALANSDTVDILVKGKGGHGATPHLSIDPIVLAARIILDLQTIVSREVNPLDPCVVTVGSIHGGTKHNIIPNEVKLQLTVRTTKDDVRKDVLAAIERIAKAAAVGAKAPEPEVVVSETQFTPATINDSTLVKRTTKVLVSVLGEKNVQTRPPLMGAEDFGRFSKGGVPIFMYFLGTVSQKRYDAAQKAGAPALPGMHTDSYFPEPDQAIRAGVRTMSAAVIDLLPVK